MASIFLIATAILSVLALSVSAQSNFNCSVYNYSQVPGDMVRLINLYQGNNSHAEYGNESNYNWSVACKSNITTIDYGCSNNFLNVVQLFNYTNSHVSVDNVYSGQVCFNTSDGSLVWSLQLSDRSTVPADYECAFAIYNYSNSHVYECGHVNASYNVNIRLATTDVIPPTGSIVIYGPNGTEYTGTDNVFLNLTYDDNIGVRSCRWANDNESNLTYAPWENCTTVKAWLLSPGYGNKTVYYEINDTAGNTAIFNDSILYYYTQDYTPPTMPTVYDGPDCVDIDWWNSNDTLHACWFNATDDISDTIYYKYRIMENGSCYGNDCNFTDAGTDLSVTVGGLTLYENWVYSFDVIAYVFNLSSGIASSNSTRIDLTLPDAPSVNSSTHPDQNRAYAEPTARLNWSAEDILGSGNRSGIEGYSYLLDRHPGTAPDNIMEDRYWQTLTTLNNNGYGQLLSANSSFGPPNTYAVFRQLHANFTENESVRVRVALAEIVSDYDDLMGVEVFLIKHANGAGFSAFDQHGYAISSIANVSQDIAYADTMDLAQVYRFSLTVNETVTDDTSDIYIVVAGLTSDNDNRNNLSIAGSTGNVDLSGWDYVCDDADVCTNMTASVDYAIEVKKADSGDEWFTEYPGLADGTYYFHVKAKDNAGNWGNTTHFRINVAAGGVSVGIVSPEDGQIFTTDSTEANISVKVMVSGNASVHVVALHPDGSNYTSPEAVFSTVSIFKNVTLELGQNELYAVANTSAGAITVSSSVYVIVSKEVIPMTNKTLIVKYSGCAVSPLPYICSATTGSSRVGMANEYPQGIGPGYIQADTSTNTIKIFMSRDFDVTGADDYFYEDEFLDLTIPSFGYIKEDKPYVVQNELRYGDVYVGGDLKLQPGKYNLYITHHGVTPDGRVNLSVEVR
ncbi:MAG: hypothetical protein KKD17_05855 [Nanoarchaeota archaeon]|nr:hypothetical protein [Nanoarchaeota archaeon]